MPSLDDIKKPIKEELKKFDANFPSLLKSDVPLLNIVTNYIIRRKGKQMRPMFVFLTAKTLGDINGSTHTAASLIELLHTATLIHDDVVDESFERRGFLSINALWHSKIAVLMGDYLLAKGLLLAVKKNEFQLLELVSDAVREMSEGELLQIQKSRKLNITEEQYFEVIRKKTAALISACTSCGAKSVNANASILDSMKLFGEYVGIAFQIRDDLFDYEKTTLIGKPTGNDIKEKKLTLPLIYALEKSSTQERKKIIHTISRHNKNTVKVKEIIEFVKQKGGLDYSEKKMKEYKNKAIDIIKNIPESESKKALIQLVEFTTTRKK